MDIPWTQGTFMTILELAHQAGVQPKWVAGTAGGEYHSACPNCGGTDRFFIQPHRQMSKCIGSYSCRRCGIHGDTIEFARQILRYSFKEAAQAANATLPEKTSFIMLKKHHIFRPATLQSPPSEWIIKATELVRLAHKNLLTKDDILTYLATRGLPLDAVLRYKFGWNNQTAYLPRDHWGLPKEYDKNGKERSLWIPKGLAIPFIDANSAVMRLKVRRPDLKEHEKSRYVIVSGSMNGMNMLNQAKHTVMVVVESELDAYAIDYALQSSFCVVASGSNIYNPDNLTDRLAKNAQHLLICHDNDEAGDKMLAKWQKLYPQAKPYPTPIGKDIGEAIQQGLDVKEWLLKAIPFF